MSTPVPSQLSFTFPDAPLPGARPADGSPHIHAARTRTPIAHALPTTPISGHGKVLGWAAMGAHSQVAGGADAPDRPPSSAGIVPAQAEEDDLAGGWASLALAAATHADSVLGASQRSGRCRAAVITSTSAAARPASEALHRPAKSAAHARDTQADATSPAHFQRAPVNLAEVIEQLRIQTPIPTRALSDIRH
jgi:hypothetical protein